MTSSNDSNDNIATLEAALEALEHTAPKVLVRKVLYDPETGLTNGFTFDDTNQPYVEITKEQYDQKVHIHTWKVVDGKLTPIVKARRQTLQLVPGNKWHTVAGNMLIVGDDDGWDKRNS